MTIDDVLVEFSELYGDPPGNAETTIRVYRDQLTGTKPELMKAAIFKVIGNHAYPRSWPTVKAIRTALDEAGADLRRAGKHYDNYRPAEVEGWRFVTWKMAGAWRDWRAKYERERNREMLRAMDEDWVIYADGNWPRHGKRAEPADSVYVRIYGNPDSPRVTQKRRPPPNLSDRIIGEGETT